jgi:hypothetical protein
MRRRSSVTCGEAAVRRRVVGRHQIVGAELHHIGAHPVEVAGVRSEYRAHQARLSRRGAQHRPHDELRDEVATAFAPDECVVQRPGGRTIIRHREARIGDVDHRQVVALARRRHGDAVRRRRALLRVVAGCVGPAHPAAASSSALMSTFCIYGSTCSSGAFAWPPRRGPTQ